MPCLLMFSACSAVPNKKKQVEFAEIERERKHKVDRSWQGWWLQEDTICPQYTVHERLHIVQEQNSSAIACNNHYTNKYDSQKCSNPMCS